MIPSPRWAISWSGYLVAPLLTAVATLAALAAERWVPVAGLGLIYVLPVVIMAVSYGWRSAMAAAVLAVLAFNYFLIEPRFTFRIEDPGNAWVLALLLITAAIVSALAAQSRRRAEVALELASHATAVQGLGRALAATSDRDTILGETAKALAAIAQAPAAVIAFDEGKSIQVLSPAGALTPGDAEAARWALGAGCRAKAAAIPMEDAVFDFWPSGGKHAPAVIGLDLSAGVDGLAPDWERTVQIVGDYLAVALERAYFAEQVLNARVRTESERVKADLLAAVSHDLKTPLSSILVALQSLRRFAGRHDRASRDQLLAVAEAETARLNGLVGNLLDMSRIDADAVAVKPQRTTVMALVKAARLRAAASLDGHPIKVQLAKNLDVIADRSLAETALANVLENAGKYSPATTPIEIHATIEDGTVVIAVSDRGPGFPNPAEPLFAKFARGVDSDGRAPGTGLGLAVARGFLLAQGGSIEAASGPGGRGGTVRIRLPQAPSKQAAA
ncbi:MAG: DUF4118 domain-containing protein [Caulobacteraceae bacterium]|nr:DUF4118 domain-containing protein [Caulobacteraceae bacterium]